MEVDAVLLHVRAPALPGLDRDLVAAGAQAGREGNRREGMSGVAKGTYEDPVSQAAISARPQ
jgi:hypothetical protein